MDHISLYKARTTNNVQPSFGLPQLFAYANQVKGNYEKHPTKPPDEVRGTTPEQRRLPPDDCST